MASLSAPRVHKVDCSDPSSVLPLCDRLPLLSMAAICCEHGEMEARHKGRLMRVTEAGGGGGGGLEERAAGATDTQRNHRRSAKTTTGNQGCLGNLALSIKHGHLIAHIRDPVGMGLCWVSAEEEDEEEREE